MVRGVKPDWGVLISPRLGTCMLGVSPVQEGIDFLHLSRGGMCSLLFRAFAATGSVKYQAILASVAGMLERTPNGDT